VKLLRVGERGAERPAVLDAGGVARDVSAVTQDFGPAFFAVGELAKLAVVAGDPAALASLPSVAGRTGAPVARPGKVVCIGLNYSDHAAETGAATPERPVMFMKDPSAVVGPYDEVFIPRGSEKTDWEVELGVVIGATARYLSSPQAARWTWWRATRSATTCRSGRSRWSCRRSGTWASRVRDSTRWGRGW